jgi:hypothetical protein
MIGYTTRGRTMFLIHENGVRRELPARGWEHFRN